MTENYAQSLQFAIMDVLTKNSNEELPIQKIYFEIPEHYKLSEYQKEDDPKCHRPRFHLEVSSILSRLKKEGFVKHRGRNCWVYIPPEE